MNIHNITNADMNNGDGLRVVLWVAGCSHHCKGCQNPITWDAGGGIPFNERTKNELFDYLNEDYIRGITFSGGDPLYPENREEIGRIIQQIPTGKDIWMYTGYTWEEVLGMNLDYLGKIDVLIDGPYKEESRDVSLWWRGSENQRVIDVKASLEKKEVILFCN